jgi:hypothetical protein
MRQTYLERIGVAIGIFRDLGPPDDSLEHLQLLEREANITRIREIIETFDKNLMMDGGLDIEDDIFFDTLVNNIRNEVVSFQTYIGREEKKELTLLEKNLAHQLERGGAIKPQSKI